MERSGEAATAGSARSSAIAVPLAIIVIVFSFLPWWSPNELLGMPISFTGIGQLSDFRRYGFMQQPSGGAGVVTATSGAIALFASMARCTTRFRGRTAAVSACAAATTAMAVVIAFVAEPKYLLEKPFEQIGATSLLQLDAHFWADPALIQVRYGFIVTAAAAALLMIVTAVDACREHLANLPIAVGAGTIVAAAVIGYWVANFEGPLPLGPLPPPIPQLQESAPTRG